MAKIIWTYESERWLKDIRDYIALDNPTVASQIILGIYKKVQQLNRFPELGHKYDVHQHSNVRILLYGHYRIAYMINKRKDITILGVYHGALDIKQYLF